MSIRCKSLTYLLVLSSLLSVAGCAELNDPAWGGPITGGPGYPPPPPRGGYYDYRYDDGYYYDNSGYYRDHYRDAHRERRQIEAERRRLEAERDRLEWERRQRAEEERRRQGGFAGPSSYTSQSNEQCPSGFHESSRRCSDRERKGGCKDIKLNNGRRCINR